MNWGVFCGVLATCFILGAIVIATADELQRGTKSLVAAGALLLLIVASATFLGLAVPA